MSITYKKGIPSLKQILNLYIDAEWEIYARYPKKLAAAFEHSQDVITAWDNEGLVGLIHTIGDKHTILYIQDILVLRAYQRQGIGSKLMDMLQVDYPDIRQIVLLTDDTDETRKFYESIGFKSCDDGTLVSFCKMKLARNV